LGERRITEDSTWGGGRKLPGRSASGASWPRRSSEMTEEQVWGATRGASRSRMGLRDPRVERIDG
jgi:hypothetical protein